MGLPFGTIHHSIRLRTSMPEIIYGLRAKRIQRQPKKALSLHPFFMHVVISPFVRWFCMFWKILSCPPIHSVIGRRCLHGITLRDNPTIPSACRPGYRKESPGYGQKESKVQPQKTLSLHPFFMPVVISPSTRWFCIFEKSFHALRYIPPSVAATFMGLPFGTIHIPSACRPGCRIESSGYGQKEYKGSPKKALSLHTFFMPVVISPFVRWFCMFEKSFHALRYIPPSVAATYMGLPFGIIYHSIRLPTWMPERISGLRAKRKQRQPPERLCLCILFSRPQSCHLLPVIFQWFPGVSYHL